MADDESGELRCLVCGVPVASVTAIDPAEAIVAPCGHHVDPTSFD